MKIDIAKSISGALVAFAFSIASSLPAHATLIPNGTGAPDCGNCTINVTYHGGPVMTGTTDIYVIWYGDWTNSLWSPAQTILPSFFTALTGSDYMNIALTYGVSNTIHYAGAINRTADLGTNLTDANILTIVQDAQTSNFGVDPNGVYFVYTAPGIHEQQDTVACGWHNATGGSTSSTKFSWVSPTPACDFLPGTVSGNDYADSLTETASHELFETLTDPNVNFAPAWFDTNLAGEIGDMCVLSNLSANLNGTNYDVQAIWAMDATYPHGICAAGNTTRPLPEPGGLAIFAICLAVIGFTGGKKASGSVCSPAPLATCRRRVRR